MARRNKGAERDLALLRIRTLIDLVQARHQTDPNDPRLRRYVRLARRIGMRYQVPLPRDVRRRVCRECDAYLVPGSTARHRLVRGRVTITCLRCGTIKRYPTRSARGRAT